MKFTQKSAKIDLTQDTKETDKPAQVFKETTTKFIEKLPVFSDKLPVNENPVALSGILQADGLVKGIVMAEILSAPKCKQRGTQKSMRTNRFKN